MPKKIMDFQDGDRLYQQFLVTGCVKGVTTAGRSYLTITFQDNTGSMEGKKWDVLPGDMETFAPGNVVMAEADVILYKTFLQIKILSGTKVKPENVDFAAFVPSAPLSKEVMIEKLNAYIASFMDDNLRLLVKTLIDKHYDAYTTYPAAVRNHHNFGSGILYHSLSMASLAEKVADLYPTVNRDILIAGTLLHDIGKTIELSGPIATKYTLEGKLLGHIAIMADEIRATSQELKIEGELPVVLEHMILSHHGKPEFGSAITPLTREALLLSMIDDLDAKMNVLDKAYQGVKPGEFTQRLPMMDDRFFYLPLYAKEEN